MSFPSSTASAALYGNDLEYRFEEVVILIDWMVLIASGVLLSVVFKRARPDRPS